MAARPAPRSALTRLTLAMRTTRRGLTVIELVLILLAIALLTYFAFRYLGRDEPPATPATEGVPTEGPAFTEPGDALAEQLSVIAPLDTAAVAGDTVPVRVRATTATGTAIANATIEFEVVTGGGTVTPASIPTNDLGEAETRWVLGRAAGPQELRAAVAGRDAASATIHLATTAAGTSGTR